LGHFGRSTLPNILIYVDVRDGRPTAPTLFALSEARRIARLAGASVYAVAVTTPLGTDELNALAGPIGDAGADKFLLCESTNFAPPVGDFTHGPGLDAAVARVPPMLVLFPAGGAGSALGPPLAARLAGPFAPWCDFLTTDAETPTPDGAGRVQLTYYRPDGRFRRRLDPLRIERPIVATLGAGRRPKASGSTHDLEVEVVANVQAFNRPAPATTATEHRPQAHLQLASVLVLIGDGDDGLPLVSPDALRAGAPPGVAVERAGDVPLSILGGCCPDIVLKVGPSPARTARSPRTRVVLAAVAPSPTDPAVEDVDVLWQFASRSELSRETLRTFLAQIGEDA
jgi:electron transfer flavoprotein alpha subunit